MGYMIEGRGLEKTFVARRSLRDVLLHPLQRAERIHALRGVDISVEPGEIFALLGPNGAGKTTLLKILSCLVLPDSGTALVHGFDTVDENEVKRRIGLVHSDERSFYWRLSARENLRFFARLYDVPSRMIETRINELLTHVGMAQSADRPFSGYSSGMKQRIAFARALLHDPPILLMDEPTRSLDPAAGLLLRQYIKEELNQGAGKTILLATHNLREAEALADRIAILVKGTVRQVGTVEQVRGWGVDEQTYEIELEGGGGPLSGPFRIVSEEETDGRRSMVIALDPGAELNDALRALFAAGVTIKACDQVEQDLELAFSRILAAERKADAE